MNPDVVVTVLTGLAGVIGGFFGGKRLGNVQAQQTAVSVVELLQVAVAELERQGTSKDEQLTELRTRVDLLESMVTQRAEVDAVHVELKEVRGVVDRIADKLGA
jgi:hypothetical protein